MPFAIGHSHCVGPPVWDAMPALALITYISCLETENQMMASTRLPSKYKESPGIFDSVDEAINLEQLLPISCLYLGSHLASRPGPHLHYTALHCTALHCTAHWIWPFSGVCTTLSSSGKFNPKRRTQQFLFLKSSYVAELEKKEKIFLKIQRLLSSLKLIFRINLISI